MATFKERYAATKAAGRNHAIAAENATFVDNNGAEVHAILKSTSVTQWSNEKGKSGFIHRSTFVALQDADLVHFPPTGKVPDSYLAPPDLAATCVFVFAMITTN